MTFENFCVLIIPALIFIAGAARILHCGYKKLYDNDRPDKGAAAL